VALGVGGGIAAYKACDLVRELRRAGATVRVAMTPAAQEFVTALTFQSLSGEPVFTDPFDPAQDSAFGHLQLSRWADVYVVAPATADLIARIRAGMANDAVTTSLLAFRGPVVIAPAMNTAMWENAATQANVKGLGPRFTVVGPDSGLLADGDVGAGRLATLQQIIDAIPRGELSGRRVLITAGPTREHLDPVRYISNPSTGKMGIALAEVARARGASVTVVLGPTHAEVPEGIEVVRVTSADDMYAATMARLEGIDAFIAAAAVSDFKPASRAPHKVKKTDAPPEAVQLERTPDVLASVSEKLSGKVLLVGFAAESQDVLPNAQRKLERKKLDFIVANDMGGFAGDESRVTVLSRDGKATQLSGAKREIAAQIWDLVQVGWR
jgi:phosphopantothenoylcysteine decarboxylase/phosphopantothenate--cysteine ligase